MRRPNILVFCTDEQRGDHLGCMGNTLLKTPNLDRLAAEGTLFRQCFCSSPVCMTARATMITGLTNRASGVYSNGVPLDHAIPTLPGILAEAGYRTHSIGKLHLQPWGGREIEDGEDTSLNPERRIYWKWPDHWEGGVYTRSPDNYYGFQTQESVSGHVNYVYGDYVTWLDANYPGAYDGYRYTHQAPGPLSIDPELHYNHWIADRAIAFMDEMAESRGQCDARGPANTDMPFFLWCSFPDPHEPFAAVKKWADVYADADIVLPPHTLELSTRNRSVTMDKLGLGQSVYDPDWTRECIRQTYGMISHVDEQVGRVLGALDAAGLAGNTVVMFISDHGDQLGEHGFFYKREYPYNAHMHVPFIAKVPWAVERGRVIEDVVSQLDLVPTVLDLAGVTHPDDRWRAERCGSNVECATMALPGEVLTPVLTGDAKPQRGCALVEHDTVLADYEMVQLRALITNDYKLVYYAPTQEVMLFDRERDPDELDNVADDPRYQGILGVMFRKLLAELARTEMRAHSQTTGA